MNNIEGDEGISPLDEYLQDVEAEANDLCISSEVMQDTSLSSSVKDDDWGDETLVNPLITPPRGWTGSQRSTPGSSSPSRHLIPHRMLNVEMDIQAFAERFKYLVCSSGLLEKDFGSSMVEDHKDGNLDEEKMGPTVYETSETDFANSRRFQSLSTAIRDRLYHLWRRIAAMEWSYWLQKGVERWDIVLAGIVLLSAVMVVLGTRRIVLSLGCLGLGMIVAEFSPRRTASLPTGPLQIASEPPESLSTTSNSDLSHRSQALQSLQSLLSASSNLDTSLTRCLSLLSSCHPDSTPLHLKPLQTALHRLCGEMTDYIASASSGLLPLVDMADVRTLGEMYDVPVLGERRTRISDVTESSGISSVQGGEPMEFQERIRGLENVSMGGVPSPKRPSPPSTIRPDRTHLFPSAENVDNLQAQMMSTTRSLPSRLGRHAHHSSLMPSPRPLRLSQAPISASLPDDRFTSLPRRTPRLSKRASWDTLNALQRFGDIGDRDELEDKKRRRSRGDEAGNLLTAWTFREGVQGKVKRSGSGRRVVREKRITEGDEEEVACSVIKDVKDPLQGGHSVGDTTGDAWTTSESDLSTEESSIPDRPSTPPTGLRPFALSSPPRQSHTPKHTSPLSGRHLSTPLRSLPTNQSLTESAIRLANLSSPPLKPHRLSLNISPPTENPKRRSLQNMPYYPSLPPSSPLTFGLSRTRSLQSHSYSDLQAVRARSATGSTTHSRRTSSVSMQSVLSHRSVRSISLNPSSAPGPSSNTYSIVPRQPHRIPSVSSLTAPALKAACLGVHLKRRRVACCLLALKWEEMDLEYWKNVRDVLDALREGMEAERAGLEVIRREVELALAARTGNGDLGIPGDKGTTLTPPWKSFDTADSTRLDFAPVRSEQQRILEHLDIVQKALERAWAETAVVRRRLTEVGKQENETIKQSWGGLREELGIMVREVERGRDTLRALDTGLMQVGETGKSEDIRTTPDHAPLPDFLKAWEDDMAAATTRSTSIGTAPTDIISSPHPPDDAEGMMPQILVPPGKDEVFQADIGPAIPKDNGLGKMCREERLGLMKLARAEGLTLGEYMRRKAGGEEGSEGKKEEMRREEGGRMVVDELKGVIGIIRDKKDRGGAMSHTQA